MTKRIYVATVVLLALVAGAMSASLQQHQSSAEDDSDMDEQITTGRSNSNFAMLEMTKTLLKEQVARATTNSEVLTLNLTNLVIMLVIKAIIFGFGFLGSVGRRSSPPSLTESMIDRTDLMMAMSYALGSATSDYSCLYRTACEEPESAQEYMTASKMLLKGAKMLQK